MNFSHDDKPSYITFASCDAAAFISVIPNSGLPKVDFWAVAEAVAVDGKTSATVAVAEAVAEGQVMMGIDLHGNLAYTPNLALFLIFKVNFLNFFCPWKFGHQPKIFAFGIPYFQMQYLQKVMNLQISFIYSIAIFVEKV